MKNYLALTQLFLVVFSSAELFAMEENNLPVNENVIEIQTEISKKEYKQAIKLFKEKKLSPHEMFQFLDAWTDFSKENKKFFTSEIVTLFKTAKNSDDSWGQINWAWMRLMGLGINQKTKAAFELLKTVSVKKDAAGAAAKTYLGYMYQHGQGVTKDYGKAKEYYLEAIKLGNHAAKNNLGFMYLFGLGINPSAELAYTYFKSAAEKGNFAALNNLGYMYETGFHEQNFRLAKDPIKAYENYKLAAEQGHFQAKVNLAMLEEELKNRINYIELNETAKKMWKSNK